MLPFQQSTIDQVEPLLEKLGYKPEWEFSVKRTWLRMGTNFTGARKVVLGKKGFGIKRWQAFLGCFALEEATIATEMRETRKSARGYTQRRPPSATGKTNDNAN
jgi:hypothetical protein